DLALPAEEPGGYVLDLTIRLLEDFQGMAAIELARLAAELAGLNRSLAESRREGLHAERLALEAGPALAASQRELLEAQRLTSEAQRLTLEAQRLTLEAQSEGDERAAELEGFLKDTKTHLQTISDELARIKATRGWRLLAAYGKVKHAVLQ